jgi:hypothetical protein
MPKQPANRLKCSFCGKTQDQVKKLIAGPGVYICDECVDLCNEILDDELFEGTPRPGSSVLTRTVVNLAGGPERLEGEATHPFQTLPESTVETSIELMESFIAAYDAARKPHFAEPFCRTLLLLQEYKWSRLDVRLLALLERLYGTYAIRGQNEACMHALIWILSIMDAHNYDNRPHYLMKLAKLHLQMQEPTRAEAVLNRMSELLELDKKAGSAWDAPAGHQAEQRQSD